MDGREGSIFCKGKRTLFSNSVNRDEDLNAMQGLKQPMTRISAKKMVKLPLQKKLGPSDKFEASGKGGGKVLRVLVELKL